MKKACVNCFVPKEPEEFYLKSRKNPKLGRQQWCKGCHNEIHRAWRKNRRKKLVQAGWDKVHGRAS